MGGYDRTKADEALNAYLALLKYSSYRTAIVIKDTDRKDIQKANDIDLIHPPFIEISYLLFIVANVTLVLLWNGAVNIRTVHTDTKAGLSCNY